MTGPMHKTCTTCGGTKTLDGFHKQKGGKYGVYSRCKHCVAERSRRYYKANREKELERSRRYQEENRDEIREYKRRYHEANWEKKSDYLRRYREENREELLEYFRRYREENREIINSKVAKREREERELVKPFATVPPRTPWTPGEDALILSDNGMTMYQKAIELGRTLISVKSRRQRLLAKLNA